MEAGFELSTNDVSMPDDLYARFIYSIEAGSHASPLINEARKWIVTNIVRTDSFLMLSLA